MRIAKPESKKIFKEHFIDRVEIATLGDKYKRRWPTVKEMLENQAYKFLKKNPSVVKEELL